MSFSTVWDILSGCSLPAQPSCSLSDPAPSVSLLHLQISEPNHSPAPQLQCTLLAWKPAWGTSFLTHNDLSIWGEVIHLACARGLHFSALIITPPPSLLRALVAASHDFAVVGLKRRRGWTDQRTAGLVFSVSLVNKPGQFLCRSDICWIGIIILGMCLICSKYDIQIRGCCTFLKGQIFQLPSFWDASILTHLYVLF